MNSIAAKLDVFKNDVATRLQAFGNDAKVFGLKVQNGVVKAAGFTGEVITDPNTQQRVEQGFRGVIDTAYGKISQLSNRAVNTMENKGVDALRAPIVAMQDLNIRRLDIREDMSSNSKSLRAAANAVITYHENVIKVSESTSRAAGDKTHAIARLAMTPVRFAAKILQIESAGAMIQNAVALAAGFAVRGIVLTLGQLGHVLPYAAAAAVVGGAGLALAALAVKVSPLVAVGVAAALTIGLIVVAQQAQIIQLGKRIDSLTNVLRQKDQVTQQSDEKSLKGRLKAALDTAAKHKKEIAAAVVLATLGVVGYQYGEDAVKLATPYVKDASEYVANTQAFQTASEYATAGYNATAEYATAGFNKTAEFVAPYAASISETAVNAASATSSYAQSVASKIVDFFGTNATQQASPLLLGN